MNNKFNNKFIELEKLLDYKFSNISLLEEALSHPSLKQIDNSSVHYERFELLGDSILGFLVTEMIFNKFVHCEEGIIAKTKAYAVSCETIVEVANSLDLSNYIIMTKGEENSGGRLNRNNIENTMEALLAAIYLDAGMEKTRKIVQKLWAKHINNIDFSLSDPKTFLQELLQKTHDFPIYKVIKKEGAVHEPIFTIQVNSKKFSAIGVGKSIKEAEKAAAKKMIHEHEKII